VLLIAGIQWNDGIVFRVDERSSPFALAVPVTIFPDECYSNFDLLEWDVKRFGPYTICKGGTVRFQWKGMHGVFQVPSIACPSNFTGGETASYKFLAPVSNGGGFEWKVPDPPNGTHGHYWVTSQHVGDCTSGMVAEFFVVDEDMDPFPSSRGHRASSLAVAMAGLIFSFVVVQL
jgi:hypothetical protein